MNTNNDQQMRCLYNTMHNKHHAVINQQVDGTSCELSSTTHNQCNMVVHMATLSSDEFQ